MGCRSGKTWAVTTNTVSSSLLSFLTRNRITSKTFSMSKIMIKHVHRQSFCEHSHAPAPQHAGPAPGHSGSPRVGPQGRTQTMGPRNPQQMPQVPHSEAVLALQDTLGPTAAPTLPLCHHSQAVIVQPEPWASSPPLLLTVTQLQVQTVTKSCDSICKTKASPFPLCSTGSDLAVSRWV